MRRKAEVALVPRARFRVEITGKVQGVGFRPAVYRYASERGINGWVSNGPEGVTIEAQGEPAMVSDFIERLRACPPAHSDVKTFNVYPIHPVTAPAPFQIVPSRMDNRTIRAALAPPDLGICEDCRAEVLDPRNRRYLYPFTNCTHCGPRFSIVKEFPYDRSNTTMNLFNMCPRCRSEYEDPADRRFHAQPNACPVCGPHVRWIGKTTSEREAAVRTAAVALTLGRIVAIQSLGGFHLACDARQKAAVEILRLRKNRPHKPLGIMAATLTAASRVAEVSAEASRILLSPSAPIVMSPSDSKLLEWIAPGLDRIGIMLPYTPLHLALFHELAEQGGPDLLVMTSGNAPGEPICKNPDDAREKLKSIADGFLVHNRLIHNRCDDSVVAVRGSGSHVIRRSRGFAPDPVALPISAPAIFAAGADLKAAACVTRGNQAFLTQYTGDLGNIPNENFYVESVERLIRFLGAIAGRAPKFVAHDFHPDMVSTRKALDLASAWGVPPESVIAVQHHHAHIAATLAEHGLDGPVIGVAFDGLGYGTDGSLWGGEFLKVDGASFSRLGYLLSVSQPGGDRAAEEIWRMALSWMMASIGPEMAPREAADLFPEVPKNLLERASRICLRAGLAPATSSVGRLFDAVAAIAGLRSCVTYEGQAAMELEAAFDEGVAGEYEFRIKENAAGIVLDPKPAVRGALADRKRNRGPAVIATRFHRGLASVTAKICGRISESTGLTRVVLGGGVFQNMRLLDLLDSRILDAGLDLYVPRRIPANDGGIALGQAWIALKGVTAHVSCNTGKNS